MIKEPQEVYRSQQECSTNEKCAKTGECSALDIEKRARSNLIEQLLNQHRETDAWEGTLFFSLSLSLPAAAWLPPEIII